MQKYENRKQRSNLINTKTLFWNYILQDFKQERWDKHWGGCQYLGSLNNEIRCRGNVICIFYIKKQRDTKNENWRKVKFKLNGKFVISNYILRTWNYYLKEKYYHMKSDYRIIHFVWNIFQCGEHLTKYKNAERITVQHKCYHICSH
jgi:hypothetical protein